MTREEKIKGLYNLKEYLVENPIELEGYKSLSVTLIDYAIEAMEQQPCEDDYIKDPCNTCEYEEGSIYCKEHCPHEAKIEQEPCEDEYIKVPKKALKYRTAGMVAYNAEWLKNHFDIERAVICGVQQPCEDAISRQAVLDKKELVELEDGQSFYCISPENVETLPSVTPQPKTGHWIYKQYGGYPEQGNYHCSECDKIDNNIPLYCPNCGCHMVEPHERSDKEWVNTVQDRKGANE